MKKNNNKEIAKPKTKKDIDKIMLLALLTVVILEVIIMIILIAIGVNKPVPIFVAVLPTIIAIIGILFLSRDVLFKSRKRKNEKKSSIATKININV